MCPCRTAPLCSSAPTSWTRKTSLANRILSWSSTEVTRMERESAALLSLSLQPQLLRAENQQYFSKRCPGVLAEILRCWPKSTAEITLPKRSWDNKVLFFNQGKLGPGRATEISFKGIILYHQGYNNIKKEQMGIIRKMKGCYKGVNGNYKYLEVSENIE